MNLKLRTKKNLKKKNKMNNKINDKEIKEVNVMVRSDSEIEKIMSKFNRLNRLMSENPNRVTHGGGRLADSHRIPDAKDWSEQHRLNQIERNKSRCPSKVTKTKTKSRQELDAKILEIRERM